MFGEECGERGNGRDWDLSRGVAGDRARGQLTGDGSDKGTLVDELMKNSFPSFVSFLGWAFWKLGSGAVAVVCRSTGLGSHVLGIPRFLSSIKG